MRFYIRNTIPEWRIFWLYFRGMISIAGGRLCQHANSSIHQYHRHSHVLNSSKVSGIPKMQVLSLIRLFWALGFPLHNKPYPYSWNIRWGFLRFRYLKRLVMNHPLSRSKPCRIIYLVQRWTNWQCNWLSSNLFCSISIYFCGESICKWYIWLPMTPTPEITWNYDLWIKCECGRKFPVSPCFN